jgi:hypothetical protein
VNETQLSEIREQLLHNGNRPCPKSNDFSGFTLTGSLTVVRRINGQIDEKIVGTQAQPVPTCYAVPTMRSCERGFVRSPRVISPNERSHSARGARGKPREGAGGRRTLDWHRHAAVGKSSAPNAAGSGSIVVLPRLVCRVGRSRSARHSSAIAFDVSRHSRETLVAIVQLTHRSSVNAIQQARLAQAVPRMLAARAMTSLARRGHSQTCE